MIVLDFISTRHMTMYANERCEIILYCPMEESIKIH